LIKLRVGSSLEELGVGEFGRGRIKNTGEYSIAFSV
jgi:hypothetical protein